MLTLDIYNMHTFTLYSVHCVSIQHVLVDKRDAEHVDPLARLDVLCLCYNQRIAQFRNWIVVARPDYDDHHPHLLPGRTRRLACKYFNGNNSSTILHQICMAMSTGYHTFCCHSKDSYHCWLSYDLCGISFSLLAIYTTGIYYAFWCQNASAASWSVRYTCIMYSTRRIGLFP